MRILYVGPYPPIPGGIAQHGFNVSEALRRRGHHVSVLTWRSQYPSMLYKGPRRAEPFGSDVEPLLSWWNPVSWLRARKAAKSFDMTIVQWVHPFHALAVATILGGSVSSVALIHNAEPHERFPLWRPLTRYALRRSAGLVAHGAGQADAIGEIVSRQPEVVAHPPNLVGPPVPVPGHPPWRLLFAGFVRHYKGADIAIKALAILRSMGLDVSLSVMGDFWEPAERYAAQAIDEGVADYVSISDRYLGDEELLSAVGDHHVLVLPYRTATQSGLIPLALAAGRPIVATTVGDLPDQVPPDAGALAPPDDPVGLAVAIEEVLRSYEAYQSGASRAATSWDDVAEAVLRTPNHRRR